MLISLVAMVACADALVLADLLRRLPKETQDSRWRVDLRCEPSAFSRERQFTAVLIVKLRVFIVSDNHEMAGGTYHLSICEGVRACKLDALRTMKKIVHSDRRDTLCAKVGGSDGNMVSTKPESCRLTRKGIDPESEAHSDACYVSVWARGYSGCICAEARISIRALSVTELLVRTCTQ